MEQVPWQLTPTRSPLYLCKAGRFPRFRQHRKPAVCSFEQPPQGRRAVARNLYKRRAALYGLVWLLTLWFMTTWSSQEESSMLGVPICLISTVAFPGMLSALVLAAIATWRSLGMSQHRNLIADNIRTLTRALIVLTLLPAALCDFFFGIPYSGLVISEAVSRSAGAGWSITTSDRGREIRLSGEVRPGLGDALREVLEATPGVERLELESPGGSVSEPAELVCALLQPK